MVCSTMVVGLISPVALLKPKLGEGELCDCGLRSGTAGEELWRWVSMTARVPSPSLSVCQPEWHQ